jgi:hypothetical protein
MLDDGVLASCYADATDHGITLFAEDVAIARAAIFVATGSALLGGKNKDAPALYGLLCRANNLLIGSPANTQPTTLAPQPNSTEPRVEVALQGEPGYLLNAACVRALTEAANKAGVDRVTFGVMAPDEPLPRYVGIVSESVENLNATPPTVGEKSGNADQGDSAKRAE